jgi:hypothetical protein
MVVLDSTTMNCNRWVIKTAPFGRRPRNPTETSEGAGLR